MALAVAAPAMIQLDAVTKQFDGKRRVVALDDVSLAIPKGEMVSIVGPSGSGKSTLLNLIGGLDRPSTGSVRIDGAPLAGLPDDELTRVRRDKIGFIFQFFNLLPTLSCLENVGLPLHLRGWPRQKVDARARELLDLVQLGREIKVRAYDRRGDRIELRAHDFPARVIQHETDHLDGVLFFDRMKAFETLTFLEEYSRYWVKD